MSLTALAWLVAFVGLAIMSLRRPAYASLAYTMTFFACPPLWWFGRGLLNSLTLRWSLIAVGILLVANFISWNQRPPLTTAGKRYLWLTALFAVNAFLVNTFLAAYPPESTKVFDILWKGCLSSALMFLTLRSRDDLELFLFGLVIGCGFVGYEIVMADQGRIEGGRLEGFMFPGAQGANGGAAILSLGLPIAGYFIISFHNRLYALISLISAPLVLESVLRCNSRGAYLGLIAGGMILLGLARGASRKRALVLCTLGAASILFLAKNEAIWERFFSIFAAEEERDKSASERLLYWEAALNMISDYPLGSGGEAAFTSPRGVAYIAHFRPEFRSVHNGVLDITAGWGVQGILLLLAILGFAVKDSIRVSRIDLQHGDVTHSLMGALLLALLADQFMCAMFTSVLDGEWFLWLAGCCVVYAYTVEHGEGSSEEDDGLSEDEQFAVGDELPEAERPEA